MPLGLIGALSLVALAMDGSSASPLAWSPEGRWIAYTIAVPSEPVPIAPGWLFEAEAPSAGGDKDVAGSNRPPAAFRLWATQVDGGESVLLEETQGALPLPCWSPDGKALAFARIVPEPGNQARFEIVVQDAPERQRVLLTRRSSECIAHLAKLPAMVLAWSPDGRYLAVPLPQHDLALAIIRADNGRVLKVLEDASLPAWSLDGAKLALAFVHGKASPSLQSIDSSFGAPRHLADLGQMTQPPFWLDGNSVACVVCATAKRKSALPHNSSTCFRITVDSGLIQKIHNLTPEPVEPTKTLLGVSFSLDHERENLFFTIGVKGQPAETVWFRPPDETRDRFPAIDFEVWAGTLTVSPSTLLLAFRANAFEVGAPPAIIEMTTHRRTLLVPDDPTRVQWIVTLVNAGRRLLQGGLAAAKDQGKAVQRPSILPVPGEFPANSELVGRLRQLARIGRPLCERSPSEPPAEPAVQALLDEARLFFDYLSQDYRSALASLDALEARATGPDQRLCLLVIRSQIYLGQGRGEQAKETIDYLRSQAQGAVEKVEDTPVGPSVSSILDPRLGWLRFLGERADDLRHQSGAEANFSPSGSRNLDPPDRELLEDFLGNPQPPRFPFAPPADDPRLEAAPDVVRPPGGNAVVVPKPPAVEGHRRIPKR